ncbi:MAG: hypothetical protein O7A69_12880 [SAR324 cluster bacterium]|nr:hypothetical protein [SAR324 cluster bacterium]
MKRFYMALALLLFTGVLLWGCASSESRGIPKDVEEGGLPVRTEMKLGDREREWALVYFQSWRQHRKGLYLNLSRQHMAQAVKSYFDLQVKIGHSFPDFYTLDRRRRSGCRFLDEIDRLAARFRVAIENSGLMGCLPGS